MNKKMKVTKDELKKVAGGSESWTKRYTINCPQCKLHTLSCVEVITEKIIRTTDNCGNCGYTNTSFTVIK